MGYSVPAYQLSDVQGLPKVPSKAEIERYILILEMRVRLDSILGR